jgi:hypothetical protein
VVAKKRGIAKKPRGQAAADWIAAGGVDPELSNAQTSESLDAQTLKHLPIAKSKSADYQRSTIYLPKHLHKQLKMAAADREVEMSDIAEQAIADWLDKNTGN